MSPKAEKFVEAFNTAMQEQIVPLLFSPAQLAEMEQPHHNKWDHYSFSNLMTIEQDFEVSAQVKPQLGLNDPRVTPAQIAALPKSLTVEVDGQVITVPLRSFSFVREDMDVNQWQRDMETTYAARAAVAEIEPKLKEKFNLVSGKDYVVNLGFDHRHGYAYPGRDPEKDNGSPTFMIQLFSAAAQKQSSAVATYFEDKLKESGRIAKVMAMGPVTLH